MEDLLNNLGVASLQPPGQQQVPVQAPQMPAAPQEPVQMYDGGIVAFANGGDVAQFQGGGYTDMSAYMPEYASNIQVPDLPGFQEFLTQAQTGLGDSGLPEYRKDIEAERERIQKEAPTDLSSFLKYVGRGLASAKSPNFINAVAEGVSTGLTMQEQAELKNREAARQLRQSEIELVQKERAEKAGLFSLAKQLEANAIDRRNSAINQNYQATQLALTGRHYEDTARNAAAKLRIDEKQLGIAAANARRSDENAKLERQIKELQLKRIQAGELEPSDKANVLKAIATQKTKLFSDLSYNEPYQKGLAEIKKKYKDPLAQQRAIQMYNQPYFEQAGISELEALLTPKPIK
jgi:hypothetical protein